MKNKMLTLIGAIVLSSTAFTQPDCNANPPGWGDSLGTVSFHSNKEWIILGDGFLQIWSDAVTATACQKTSFSGGVLDDFNADCRSAQTNLTGHFFSWCAVMRFAHQLCPAPWRVPTTQDFANLHQNLGHALPAVGSSVSIIPNTYMGTSGTASAPTIGGTWGGARFTGHAGMLTGPASIYWSLSEPTITTAGLLSIHTDVVWPQGIIGKDYGFALRCVR